jgi:hypothetical protein
MGKRRQNGWQLRNSSAKWHLAMIQLPPEFLRLLKSLNSNGVEYLVVGGYAVIFHGYVRTTGDLDVWISLSPANAAKAVSAVSDLGYNPPWLKPEILLKPGAVLRIGTEPLRFDIINEISGVSFSECYTRRIQTRIDEVDVAFIALDDLKQNKRTAGRNKDLADLDYLP